MLTLKMQNPNEEVSVIHVFLMAIFFQRTPRFILSTCIKNVCALKLHHAVYNVHDIVLPDIVPQCNGVYGCWVAYRIQSKGYHACACLVNDQGHVEIWYGITVRDS
jgi:hypothetical protein